MSLSDFDRSHVQQILDKPDGYTWFSAHLLRLIAKADDGNRERIRVAFPEHVEAFEDWSKQRGPYAPKDTVPS